MLRNALQPASAIDLARWWFLKHIGRLQVLVVDRVVLPDESERFLVVEVLRRPTHLLMRLGKQPPRLTPAVAVLHPSRHPSLRPLEIAFRDAEDARVGDLAAIG